MSFPASRSSSKKLRKNRGGPLKPTRLQTTSLIDIMTIILVFLLKSFSSEGEIVTLSKGLRPPESTAKKKPEVALRLSLTQNDLLFEGTRIATIDTVYQTDDLIIPSLLILLNNRRKMTERIAENSAQVEFKGDVLIEADRKVRFKMLQKIMYTCGQIGFSNFSLLVLKKE
jgi:biopolymer transport protein ExbD